MPIKDLDSLDQPLQDGRLDPPKPTPEATDLLWECRNLLDNAKASWAWDTVEGIRETVRRTGRASKGQIAAIGNIADRVAQQAEAGEDRRTRGGSRRYEGFRR